MQPILIKYMRTVSGFTQKELAEAVGVNHSFISKIEAGTKPVTSEVEAKLVDVFAEAGIDTEITYYINSIINRKEGKEADAEN